MRLDRIFADDSPFPHGAHEARYHAVAHYQRLFENDRELILAWSNAMRKRKDKAFNTEFVAYPAPELAARTLSSFLFGENATISSDEPSVSDALDRIVEENQLHALNQEAAVTCGVEGEVYYRLDWNPELSDVAIIDAVGGSSVFPVFVHRRLVEVAFVRDVTDWIGDTANPDALYRHVEIRERGRTHHRLFKGREAALGRQVSLELLPDFEDLDVDADGISLTEIDDLLVRHVPFWRTTSSPHGISIFRGKDGLVEAIHSLYTQDQHDAEMAKKRIAVASEYLKREGKRPVFDRSLDLFELSDTAAGAVGGDVKPVHPIEFNDSTVQGERIAQRIDEFLLACGIAPQSAGRDVTGSAESGTARRLAQSLTLATVATAARYFTPALRDVLDLALLVGAKKLGGPSLPETAALTVELEDGVPDDPRETAEVVARLRGAGALSVREAVRWIHPDYTAEQVDDEVALIEEEQGLNVPDVFATPAPEPEES